MRRLSYIIVVISLLVSACGVVPRNSSEQIAVIDWQKASSVHPRYQEMQNARTELAKAVKFRNEQAEQGKRQIALLNKMVEIKQSGKQSFMAADFLARMAEREAEEREKLPAWEEEARREADQIVAPEREKILEFYQLPILNLRLKLENVKLTAQQRTSLEQELQQTLEAQYSELNALEKRRQGIIRGRIAEKIGFIKETMSAYAAGLKASLSQEQSLVAKVDEEKLGQGPKELAKLMASLDKQVELKQKNYDRLRAEIDADVQSALLKVLAGKNDILVVRNVLVNIAAADLTDKVSAEIKNRKK